MTLVMRGLGRSSDEEGQVSLSGFGRDSSDDGGGPPAATPYGNDRAEQVHRDDVLSEARSQERIGL